MKTRILFVDDESHVLNGLQRMLRSLRHGWEMAFARSGKEALGILAKRPFDVIVSDMRMPGMDGAKLLTEVKRRHPDVVRIVLSGHSDRETILKTVRLAHQYLSKPCEPQILKSTVARAIALRDLLQDKRLKRIVSQMDSLPSLPSLYLEVVQELQSPDSSLNRVGQIIAKDVGMTAKILQLVNSAFFGIPRRVSSPAQAASLLGLETLKALVLSVQIFARFHEVSPGCFNLERLWTHSLSTGAAAKAIARSELQDSHLADDAFMDGLLHDCGKLVLATNFPKQFCRVISALRNERIPVCEAERQTFGTSHSEVGAYLMGLWGLPHVIVEAIAFHHTPVNCPGEGFTPLTAVHVANAFNHERDSSGDCSPEARIDLEYLTRLNLAGRLSTWRELCQDAAGEGESYE